MKLFEEIPYLSDDKTILRQLTYADADSLNTFRNTEKFWGQGYATS